MGKKKKNKQWIQPREFFFFFFFFFLECKSITSYSIRVWNTLHGLVQTIQQTIYFLPVPIFALAVPLTFLVLFFFSFLCFRGCLSFLNKPSLANLYLGSYCFK